MVYDSEYKGEKMKRVVSLVVVGAAVFALSGCGGGAAGGAYKDYYITDEVFAGVNGIVWSCDSGTNGITNNSGNFYTDAGDNCDLDLDTNSIVGKIYLEDDIGSLGVVSYYCIGNAAHPGTVNGTTASNGFIENASYYASCTLFNLP